MLKLSFSSVLFVTRSEKHTQKKKKKKVRNETFRKKSAKSGLFQRKKEGEKRKREEKEEKEQKEEKEIEDRDFSNGIERKKKERKGWGEENRREGSFFVGCCCVVLGVIAGFITLQHSKKTKNNKK